MSLDVNWGSQCNIHFCEYPTAMNTTYFILMRKKLRDIIQAIHIVVVSNSEVQTFFLWEVLQENWRFIGIIVLFAIHL